MPAKKHWEKVYRTKAPDAVSWYAPHLETSLALIRKVCPEHAARLIDVGGGESTLVDDLLREGYGDITVLDLSETALQVARARLGEAAARVRWIAGDITTVALPAAAFDLWHDRAVFHFLTDELSRRRYVRQVAHSVKPGGFVIVAAFGPQGPTHCSGLEVARYAPDALHAEFGARFRLLRSEEELHRTPFGTTQQFVYCLCRMEV
ncbi:MAG TPA: class I SAM-dependent methyltransferase [Burkholderiales bacterium]|nr:class I SAM-dependent methyltransferase [Burkholderiales bacterium]